MLHAAAMLVGLWALWLLLTQRWGSGEDIALALGVAAACVVIAARFGGVERNVFSNGPRTLMLLMARAPAVLGGAVSTLCAALAADVTLKPALVRVKPRLSSADTRATLAGVISAAPGAVVVEANAEGLLTHVIDEDAVDAEHLGALEAQVLSARGGGAPS